MKLSQQAKACIIILLFVAPAFAYSQYRGTSYCEKPVYPMLEISAETGKQTAFNISAGLTSLNSPFSAHLLVNIATKEATFGHEDEPDVTINPMLMLRALIAHSPTYRHNMELVLAGGTSDYRAGIRYFYTLNGSAAAFVQPTLNSKGYVTNFGVSIVL
ncbi:hypothetical protein [Foetidibacter luteolus]|uniref:hypothetical protein n=1 Tax=Foetidibacter luteolus TaxID=2608880 RepID=UPI00129AE46F|nr:hypothetical protein [Foetidibacter luteolus]